MSTSTDTRAAYRELLRAQPVLPAPMCGISDHAYRAMCREYGGPLAFTQMVASEAISRGDRKSLGVLDLHGPEPNTAMQLFGCDPERLAESARVVQELGAVVVDLNMGCPARKVTGSNGGSALLKDLDRVRAIFRAMRAVVRVPFTAKMRWDWDGADAAALNVARIAEEEGLDGLCLHARTREQGYSGRADWARIAEMKRATSLPVIGNGDIRCGADAVAMMRETGCDAVMLGRGIIGSPWVLRDCMRAVAAWRAGGRGAVLSDGDEAPGDLEPSWDERRDIMMRHATRMVECKGARGMVEFRKHAAAYMRGVRGVKRLRQGVMKLQTLADLEEALRRGPEDEIDDGGDLGAGAGGDSPPSDFSPNRYGDGFGSAARIGPGEVAATTDRRTRGGAVDVR